MILVFCVPVFAVDNQIIYGEKSDTKIYNSPINLNEFFNTLVVQPQHISLAYISNSRFTSTAMSGAFYSSTGKIRVTYAHVASTNGTVTAKLVNDDNGAESMPITISGQAGQTKSTTLTWSSVPNGNWRLKLNLSPSAPTSNPWGVHADVWDN